MAALRLTHPTPPDWHDNAACAGANPDLFFPERGDPSGLAKQICATCPVRTDCLEYALANSIDYGVWGGTSERERRRLRRDKRLLHPDDCGCFACRGAKRIAG